MDVYFYLDSEHVPGVSRERIYHSPEAVFNPEWVTEPDKHPERVTYLTNSKNLSLVRALSAMQLPTLIASFWSCTFRGARISGSTVGSPTLVLSLSKPLKETGGVTVLFVATSVDLIPDSNDPGIWREEFWQNAVQSRISSAQRQIARLEGLSPLLSDL